MDKSKRIVIKFLEKEIKNVYGVVYILVKERH